MTTILTNPRVANQIDELELRARRGDPWAQAELQKRCMQFSVAMMEDSKLGADMTNRKELLK